MLKSILPRMKNEEEKYNWQRNPADQIIYFTPESSVTFTLSACTLSSQSLRGTLLHSLLPDRTAKASFHP
jgi:hypothetical protein